MSVCFLQKNWGWPILPYIPFWFLQEILSRSLLSRNLSLLFITFTTLLLFCLFIYQKYAGIYPTVGQLSVSVRYLSSMWFCSRSLLISTRRKPAVFRLLFKAVQASIHCCFVDLSEMVPLPVSAQFLEDYHNTVY